MLTGKAKEDFELTLGNVSHFYTLDKGYQNRKIINWFNSIDINLTFRKAKLGGCMCYFSNEFNLMGWNDQECKEKSIDKANEIYNSRNYQLKLIFTNFDLKFI